SRAEAHPHTPGGVLEGCRPGNPPLLNSAPRDQNRDMQKGSGSEVGEVGPTVDGARSQVGEGSWGGQGMKGTVMFVNASSKDEAHVEGGSLELVLEDLDGWAGGACVEALPGAGLHRKVLVTVSAVQTSRGSKGGKKAWQEGGAGHVGSSAGESPGGDPVSEREVRWDGGVCDPSPDMLCEVLLSQHLPAGAYIDIDEVKARNDYELAPHIPLSDPPVHVSSWRDSPIDVELPSSVSGQHLVGFRFPAV
ncbi:unnamed protein product, partial [Discosporangium mesarthrocarpum]